MEQIENLARTLHGSITNDVHKVKNIERKHPGEVAAELQDLREDLTKNEGRASELVVHIEVERERHTEEQIRIGNLENLVCGMDDNIKKLNGKLQEHEKEHSVLQNELSRLKNSLHTGQIAYQFEKDLAKYIYPDGKKFGSRQVFTKMKDWLENKKNTPQGREAEKKWNALKTEFKWSTEHENVFFKLLRSRIEFAHPTVDWNLARAQIPDNFTEQEKNCIIDIIAITERVNEMMANA